MNREDIICMAREVFDVQTDSRGRTTFSGDNYAIERFAALVASAEREFYMQLFLDPENQPTQFGTATQEYREQEVREAKQQERHEFKEHALAMARAAIIGAVKNEREACAKECEGINSAEDYYGERPELVCAEVIRARGQA